MLFNSFEFIFLFLPIVLTVYFALNKFGKNSLSKGWLVLASLYFYGYFNYSYLILILMSILVNYTLGNLLHLKDKSNLFKKNILILGVIFNVGALGYFKYFDFFVKNINFLFKSNLTLLNIVLPLGISFFTFQQLSFIVDSYRGKSLKYDFLSYCLFVTFFPQLIAGPIVLPEEMLPQFEDKKNKSINYENINRGFYLFTIGLAKKVLIADTIATFANTGFDKMQSLTFVEGWLTTISYTLQLYYDFSGYCDMAMGIGLMFNIMLPQNFNSPYKASNIQEFWKRWHMTLGRFLTNYLYIPLGGNRVSELKVLRNLLVVFLVSGIWHGAGWMFIIWGLLHGVSILVHRIWKNLGYKMPKILGTIITLFCVNIFWVFFRANSFDQVKKILYSMFILNKIDFNLSKFYTKQLESGFGVRISLAVLIFALILILNKNSIIRMKNMELKIFNILENSFYFLISIFLLSKVSTFLYFNF